MGVKIKGLRELQRALRKVGSEVPRGLNRELRAVAEPVAATARAKASRWRGVGPIRAGARRGGAVVRQSKGTVTGNRGDFGVLQMQEALIPAAEEHEHETVVRVEHMLDRIVSGAGF